MEHCAHVKQFGVVFQATPLAGQGGPEKHPPAMIVEQVVLGISDEFGGGLDDGAVGHWNSSDDLGHFEARFYEACNEQYWAAWKMENRTEDSRIPMGS
jgi:hypothetical protein